MGWSTATPIVRGLTIAVFVAVAATYGVSAYKPANPQLPLLAFASVGIGGIMALCTLKIGNALTHPWTRGQAAFWTSRETYTRRTSPILLQLAIWLAVGGLLFAHALVWKDTHDTLSGVTAIVMLAIIAYPFARYRIERGRWPD